MTEVVACASPPPEVRVSAWLRGERPTSSCRPLSAWEPGVYRGGRAYPSPIDARRLDALVHVVQVRTTDPRQVIGAKPAAFCWWVEAPDGAVIDCLDGAVRDPRGGVVHVATPHRVDWVIAGGESGPHARRMDPEWARSIRHDCAAAGVPFLFKQTGSGLAREWGLSDAKGEDPRELPTDLRVRQWPAPLALAGGTLL